MGFEPAHGLDEVRHRSTEPIEFPRDERIAAADVGERLGETGAIGLRARGSLNGRPRREP